MIHFDNNTLVTEIVGSLKYLSNFWKFLDFALVNYEIELNLRWTTDCLISQVSTAAGAPETSATSARFQINSSKIYNLAVILSINNNIKFLKNLEYGFKKQFLGINIELK